MTLTSTNPKRPLVRRRWMRGLIVVLLLSPVALWLGSNAWLHSRWGQSWLESEIQQRTQWTVRIGGAGWLPGGQVWLDDLRVVLPEPNEADGELTVLQIQCVSLRPAWRAWLRGSRKISDVCLSQPRLVIPLDALPSLIPAPVVPVPVTPPAVAAHTPAPDAVAAPAPTPAPPTAVAAEPSHDPEPPSPTVWLKVWGGQLTITHPSMHGALWQMENISADLPIGGAPASGHVQCDAIQLLRSTLCPQGRIAIRWRYPIWESEETPLSAFALQARAKFQLARLPGLPFSFLVAQDPQAWKSPDGSSSIDQVQSIHQLSGYLLAPHTWRGESAMEAQSCQLLLGSRDVQGYLAQSRFLLQGGLLQCTDLRWLGDDFGITGNGMLSLRGEMLGSLRFIAPRTTALASLEKWHRLLSDQPLPFQPLFNEDRLAVDTLWGGTLAQPWFSLDQGRHWLDPVKLWRTWNLTPTPPSP